MKKENSISRRSFLKSSALAGALGAIGTGSTVGVLTSCGGGESANAIKPLKEPGTYYVPELPDLATDGKELKAGVIGCGGRGSGAAFNFLNAANGVTIVALGDTFQERVDDLAKKLKDEKGIDVPADKRFVGLDAYKQVIDSGVDVVIVATPPVFRPVHFQYATEKGKHSFLEKPICVDHNDQIVHALPNQAAYILQLPLYRIVIRFMVDKVHSVGNQGFAETVDRQNLFLPFRVRKACRRVY